MLSVLIPLYNYNAFPLAKAIVEQSLKLNIDFELICIDDASNSELNTENEKINCLQNAKFIAQKVNAGYRGNRNNLAAMAKFDYLLFIDGDSIIVANDYVKNYIENLSENTQIIYGGRVHPNTIVDKTKTLRWKYGKFVEDKTAEVRQKNVYKTLMFNNTLIKKTCFSAIEFDTSLTKYGHDDTVFSFEVSNAKLNVKHINNPIEHGDIDSNQEFLRKTEESLINLHKIYYSKKVDYKFIKILNFYNWLEFFWLTNFVAFIFKLIKPSVKKQLLSSRPSLLLFNFYKLGFLANIKNTD